jgi:hypothetical protein
MLKVIDRLRKLRSALTVPTLADAIHETTAEANLAAHRATWLRACYTRLGAEYAPRVHTAPADGDLDRAALRFGRSVYLADINQDRPETVADTIAEKIRGAQPADDDQEPGGADPLDDERMDGVRWSYPVRLPIHLIEAWPFWECADGSLDDDERVPVRVGSFAEVNVSDVDTGGTLRVVRPLRLPGMNEDGEIAARDMTPGHFERVAAGKWQFSDDRGHSWHRLQEWSGGMPAVGVRPDSIWRPAIFAQLPQDEAATEEPSDVLRRAGAYVRITAIEELDEAGELELVVAVNGVPGSVWVSRQWWAAATPKEWLTDGDRQHSITASERDRAQELAAAALAILLPHIEGEPTRVDVAAQLAVDALVENCNRARAHAVASATKLAGAQEAAAKLSRLYDVLGVDSLDAAIAAAIALAGE